MSTTIKSASVKVMLSYDYSHFEASMSLENDKGLEIIEIDNARKVCQRLADKAVGQYKTAKQMAQERTDGEYRIRNFAQQCEAIAQKNEEDRTVKESAMLKTYRDEKWMDQFIYNDYDYDDDDQYNALPFKF
jgi:hypothetical protein